jgi:hypothetical protein
MRITDPLRTLQEDVAIALLRRPSLGWAVKGTGLDEQHSRASCAPHSGLR